MFIKFPTSVLTAGIAILLCVLPPGAASALDITYPGYPLATNPLNTPNSLFPDGSLSNNTVSVTGGSISGDVDGGIADSNAAVTGNTVTVTGTPSIAQIYGGRSSNGPVSDNRVIFDSGLVTNAIIGGRSATGTATGNSITINDGSIANVVRGGQSDGGGQVAFNTVTVNGGSIGSVGNVLYGGYANTGAALNNTVVITGGTIGGFAFGGSSAAEASGNTVRALGGTITGDITGGSAGGTGHATGNLIQLDNVTAGRQVIAGDATGSGDANDNVVEMTSGQLTSGSSLFAGVARNGGNVMNNHAIIRGGSVTTSVYAGMSSRSLAIGNVAELMGGTVGANFYGGATSSGTGSGSAVRNKAFIYDGGVGIDVYGGVVRHTNSDRPVNENEVHMSGGSVGGSAYGGQHRGTGESAGNIIEISGGTVNGGAYGGHSASGAALDNSAEISGGTVSGVIAGGFSQGGEASGNSVDFGGNASAGGLIGGRGEGSALDNTLRVTGGTVTGDALAGLSNAGPAQGNSAEIGGGSVGGQLIGGRGASASGNSVAAGGGSVTGTVIGGDAVNGEASGNSVDFGGSASAGGLIGGRGESSALDNTLRITGGTVSGSAIAGSGAGSSSVSGNTAAMSGGLVGGDLVGGSAPREGANINAPATITDNAVTLTGGTVTGAVVGGDRLFDGDTVISGNRVDISAGRVAGGVYGGRYAGSGPYLADVSGNLLDISGGVITGGVYGGFAQSGQAMNNAVTLSGAPDLAGATLFGGMSGSGGDAFSGNTLNVTRFRGAVTGIHNFENYNFLLPNMGNGEVLISVLGPTPTNVDNTTIRLLGMDEGPPLLQPGDKIILISKGLGTPAVTHATQVPKGLALLYDFDVYTDGGALVASLRKQDTNPDAGVLPLGPAASLALLGQSADIIADLSERSLLEAEEKKGKPSVYAVTTGGSYRYDADASLDVHGASALAGINWYPPLEKAKAVLGVFFETGTGDYNARHGKGLSGDTRGDGDLDYYGVGVLGGIGLSTGPYAEASLRAGRAYTSFMSDYLRDSLGRDVEYDLSQTYYGAHAGLGWLQKLNERAQVNAYGKYMWVRQEGKDVTIEGEKARFKDGDSHRARGGARVSYEVTPGLAPYVGAAYEYEFDGKTRADIGDIQISASSLRGGSGIGELGLAFSTPDGLAMDLSVRGYEGTREGVEGRLMIGITF